MLKQLEQMLEINKALEAAGEKGDVDRILSLVKHRKELADRMGPLDPGNPDVKSGKVAQMLKDIVIQDGKIEKMIRELMGSLKDAIQTVKGEQNVVEGYLKKAEPNEPRFLDKEG
jgi:hypothetical protein